MSAILIIKEDLILVEVLNKKLFLL